MLLWSETLAVVPVTIHVPLSRVPDLSPRNLVVETARIVDHDMRTRFGLARPRLVLAGLNPHAGEAGTMGTEEPRRADTGGRVLAGGGHRHHRPATRRPRCSNPGAGDLRRGAFAPTHDQALIPIKTLAFDEGVNVTLGLRSCVPRRITAPAFDIAARGWRSPTAWWRPSGSPVG